MSHEQPCPDSFQIVAAPDGRRVRIELRFAKSFEIEEIHSMRDGVSRAVLLAAVGQAMGGDTTKGAPDVPHS